MSGQTNHLKYHSWQDIYKLDAPGTKSDSFMISISSLWVL
jgi:hypothetical protein